ncbi:sensor histidine kinase [Nesterenkonia marinintestina]|uniref:sensor histidine kinase n=1 Tax=Nesterenkonia marinintestina TaxID=2979865 RepID=UPI0021C01A00|nr:sensor histidine kinase [Nesterenkonia sp. GX14115]
MSPTTEIDEEPRADRLGMVYAAVWLIFLLPVVIGIHYVQDDWGPRVYGYLMMAVFVAVYMSLMARWVPIAERGRWPRASRLAAGVAALLVLVGLIGLVAEAYVAGLTPYLAALVVFTQRPRSGIPVGVALWLVPTLFVALVWEFPSWWLVAGPGIGILFICVIRMTEHYAERDRRVGDQLRQAQERDAIARDVHDVLGHSLTVLSIKAQLANRLIDIDPDRARGELRQIDELAREALSQVRSTVTRLRTPELETEIESVRSALDAAGVDFDLDAEADPAEIADPDRMLAWTLREAVTNVLRHARAQRCRVELTAGRISISDDGVGLPADAGTAAGNGLRGLRERAQAAGARLEAGPGNDGAGTRVEVRL